MPASNPSYSSELAPRGREIRRYDNAASRCIAQWHNAQVSIYLSRWIYRAHNEQMAFAIQQRLSYDLKFSQSVSRQLVARLIAVGVEHNWSIKTITLRNVNRSTIDTVCTW